MYKYTNLEYLRGGRLEKQKKIESLSRTKHTSQLIVENTRIKLWI